MRIRKGSTSMWLIQLVIWGPTVGETTRARSLSKTRWIAKRFKRSKRQGKSLRWWLKVVFIGYVLLFSGILSSNVVSMLVNTEFMPIIVLQSGQNVQYVRLRAYLFTCWGSFWTICDSKPVFWIPHKTPSISDAASSIRIVKLC